MATVVVNKIAAAQRQLDAAIRWLFAQEDILPVHTVAAAARRLLCDIAEERGLTIVDYEGILRNVYAQLTGKHPDPAQMAPGTPQFKKWFQKEINRPTNFLKHAEHDVDTAIDSSDLNTDYLLLEACATYSKLGLEWTPEMHAYARWHLAVYPHESGDKISTAAGNIDTLPRPHQLEFGEFLLDLMRSPSGSEQENERPQAVTEREAAVKEALEQIREGRTVPAEEVEAWIDSWDTSNELPVPSPHRR